MSSRLALLAVFVIAFVGGILMGMLGLHAAREIARREGYAAAVDSVRALGPVVHTDNTRPWRLSGMSDTLAWMHEYRTDTVSVLATAGGFIVLPRVSR